MEEKTLWNRMHHQQRTEIAHTFQNHSRRPFSNHREINYVTALGMPPFWIWQTTKHICNQNPSKARNWNRIWSSESIVISVAHLFAGVGCLPNSSCFKFFIWSSPLWGRPIISPTIVVWESEDGMFPSEYVCCGTSSSLFFIWHGNSRVWDINYLCLHTTIIRGLKIWEHA